MSRESYLSEFSMLIARAARDGLIDGRPLHIESIDQIDGPRAGALEMLCGFDSGRLLDAFSKSDGALLRQFIPWSFPTDPSCYMSGRFVRVEAAWPDGMATKLVTVEQMNRRPYGPGYWIAGMSENGRPVVPHLSDAAPHWSVSGTTGSGKTIALRQMATQFSERGLMLVLADGKYGEGLRGLEHLPGVVGPLVRDVETTQGALSWLITEMTRRYETRENTPRLVLMIDEVQEFIKDKAIAEMIRRLTALGRSAGISVIMATQHPTVDNFGGPTTKRNIDGHIALRVSDWKASEVALNRTSPRADHLLGAGDSLVAVGGLCERCQIAVYPEPKIERMLIAQPRLPDWPEFNAESDLPDKWPGADELAAAIAIVHSDRAIGRVKFVQMLTEDYGLKGMSPERANNILKYSRAIHDAAEGHGLFVRSVDDVHTKSSTKTDRTRRNRVYKTDRTNEREE